MAEFIRHEPCPKCGSRDNLARYSDGSASCFGFSCDHWEPPTDEGADPDMPKRRRTVDAKFLSGTARRLRSRKLTQETCQKFNYQQGRDAEGNPVQIAPYYDENGQLVAQKIRTKDKRFYWIGDPDKALPFGAQLWPKSNRSLVVTEGEIDAMAMSQAQGHGYPVVSVASGAGRQIKKYMARHGDYWKGFDQVVLMFDMDEAGRRAAEVAASVVGYERAKIADLPLKDPGAMIEAGRSKELRDAFFKAKKFSPEGIVDLADLKDSIKERPRRGHSWWSPTLTELTYGKRYGELVALGGGTGTGKTDFILQDIKHNVEVHGNKVGAFLLEQNPKESGTRLVGKFAEVPLHIPDCWDEDIFEETWEKWITEGKVYLYDSFGVNTWEAVKDRIKFLYHAHDVRDFYLDHLTALAASVPDNERKVLDGIMGELGSLVKELDIMVTFISHLATPDGTPHEEGGRVKTRHFRGSRSIGFWSHYIFGLERDQQAENSHVRNTATFRILKDRYTGRATGETFYIGYDFDTGMLYETAAPSEAEEHGFEPLEEDTDSEGNADF